MSSFQKSELQTVRAIIVRMKAIREHYAPNFLETSMSLEELLPSTGFNCLYLLGLSHEKEGRENFSITAAEAVIESVSRKLGQLTGDSIERDILISLRKLEQEQYQDFNMENMNGSTSAEIFYPLEKFLVFLTVIDGLEKYTNSRPGDEKLKQDFHKIQGKGAVARIFLREVYGKIVKTDSYRDVLAEAFYGWTYRDRLFDAEAWSAKSEISFYESLVSNNCQNEQIIHKMIG